MIFTIVGRGFGLYGYAPAVLARFPGALVLPEEYRGELRRRPELRPYEEAIRWRADRETAWSEASAAILATPPSVQERLVEAVCAAPHLRLAVLEKPVAAAPDAAARVLEQLDRSRKRVRVGYTFLHTRWNRGLAWPSVDRSAEVEIAWTFLAHHFKHDLPGWKRVEAEGGGVLRFYGIHVLALLASRGYDAVSSSATFGQAGEPERWEARFTGGTLPPCHVVVDSRASDTRFVVASCAAARREMLVDQPSPFGGEPEPYHRADPRIPVVGALLDSIDEDDERWLRLYQAVNDLWTAVEACNVFAATPR